MEQSILNSTKKLLGVGDGDTSFDLDIITHINAAFSHLFQLGIGPNEGFEIEDDAATWNDFLTESAIPTSVAIRNAVKQNVWLRVRLMFDPPEQWHILNSTSNQLTESDARLSTMRESTEWKHPDLKSSGILVVDGGYPTEA